MAHVVEKYLNTKETPFGEERKQNAGDNYKDTEVFNNFERTPR